MTTGNTWRERSLWRACLNFSADQMMTGWRQIHHPGHAWPHLHDPIPRCDFPDVKCVTTFPHLLHPQASWTTLNMHASKFTRPFAFILAIACLMTVVPTLDVPNSAAIMTHLPVATSTIDKTGGLMLKQDSSHCCEGGVYCNYPEECCSGYCDFTEPGLSTFVSALLLIAEKGKPWALTILRLHFIKALCR